MHKNIYNFYNLDQYFETLKSRFSFFFKLRRDSKIPRISCLKAKVQPRFILVIKVCLGIHRENTTQRLSYHRATIGTTKVL